MISANKILVPFDFSDEAREALTYAAELGARLGAEVDVLHVWLGLKKRVNLVKIAGRPQISSPNNTPPS